MMAFALLTFFIGPLSGTLSDRIGCRGLGIAGLHWCYLTGALFSMLSAIAVFLAKSDLKRTQA